MKRYILFLLATLLSAAVPGQTAARTDSLAQHPQSEQTASAAYASDPDKLWDQANTAYINNDFPTAISLYETILSSGRQSGKLYYNLANAYFKEQEIGRAILNYNRALRLNPGNEDIRYNLQVAEKMTKDHIDAVPEFFVKTWLSNLRNLLSSTTWAVLSLVFLAAMLGSALFYLLSRRLVRRKIGFYGTATAFLLLVLTLCFAAIDRREAIDRTSAVVLRDAVAVKSSPDQNSTDKLWDQANTAYINNDFPTAISLYETILSSGRQSGKLYYNLANAYFKEQEIGRAILNYNRALRLNPGNEDIRYNLQVAEKMTKDHIDAVPEFFVKTWLSNLRNLLSSTTWAVLSLVFLAAMLGSALFYLLSRRLVRRKIGFYGTATAFLLLVLTLCFAAIDRREAIDRTSAVVLRDAVAVKSSPDQNSTDLFILHEGTKVEISDRLNGWCEITIADGKKGWMECSTFETI